MITVNKVNTNGVMTISISVPLDQSKYSVISWLTSTISTDAPNVNIILVTDTVDVNSMSDNQTLLDTRGSDIIIHTNELEVVAIVDRITTEYYVPGSYANQIPTTSNLREPQNISQEVRAVSYSARLLWDLIETHGLIQEFKEQVYPNSDIIARSEDTKLITGVGFFNTDILVVVENGSNEELFYDVKFLIKLQTFISSKMVS